MNILCEKVEGVIVKMMMMMMMTTISVAGTHECYSTGARIILNTPTYMISLNPQSPLETSKLFSSFYIL